MLHSVGHKSMHKARNKAKNFVPCLVVFCIALMSCSNDMEQIRFFDRKDLPQQSLRHVKGIRSEYGDMQMMLISPWVESYAKPEKKTVYPQGVHLQLFDRNSDTVADIRADYACRMDDKNITEIRGNVTIIDFRTGDTSYLQDLTWNENEHRIFSEHAVKSVNGQRVTYGDGFESDENFNKPLILRQRGTMTIEDE